jgi:hypothetical protein
MYAHPKSKSIRDFYKEVLGLSINLAGVRFPEKEGFPNCMVRCEGFDEDFVVNKLCKHFSVNKYFLQAPAAKYLNRNLEQKRPNGLYVFAYVGGDEPDVKHLGKSYEDAMAEQMIFANPLEYLLMTGFHQWEKQKWMDISGSTLTSSLWLDGGLVSGFFDPHPQELYLLDYSHDLRRPSFGPCELFLG